MKKLASRKLWVAIGAALASIATTIAGFNTDNEVIAIVGLVCAVASACIYNICEALVDSSYADEPTEDNGEAE